MENNASVIKRLEKLREYVALLRKLSETPIGDFEEFAQKIGAYLLGGSEP